MTRTMYDGINADASLIAGVAKREDLVCWYAAGNSYIWTDAEKALFLPGQLVSITLTADFTEADVLDVEIGGATPDQTGGWITRKKAAGYLRPTVYCSLGTVPAVRAGTGRWVLGRDYDLWVADWNGARSLPYPSAAAKQYADPGAYDISVVFDDNWPHRKATFTPPPPPPPVFKTAISPQVVIRGVPTDADHIVVNATAIVHGKPVPLTSWHIKT